jgi:hypothetical protein
MFLRIFSDEKGNKFYIGQKRHFLSFEKMKKKKNVRKISRFVLEKTCRKLDLSDKFGGNAKPLSFVFM